MILLPLTTPMLIALAFGVLTQAYALPRAKDKCPGGTLDARTGNPSQCPNETRFFAQLLDHEKEGCETFPQQFDMISDYFRPGGPIILYQGAETPAISCASSTLALEMAEEFNGIAVSLEHRFFGLSTPHGLNFTEQLNWSSASLEPLTLNNVLLDSVRLVEWIKSSHPGAQDSKAIVLGGSYGGFLTSMLRIHHSDTFAGAVASSAGLKLVTSPKNPEIYAEGNWLNSIYLQLSASAAGKIQAGFEELKARMSVGHFDGLDKDLNLCYPPNATEQFEILSNDLFLAFYTAAQYNYPFQQGEAPLYSLQSLIDGIKNTTEPLDALRLASELSNQQVSAPCKNWNPVTRGNGNLIPFQWITCKYFPYRPSVYSTADSIFGNNAPDFDTDNLQDGFCLDAFNIKSISGGGLAEEYGISQSDLEATAGIIFSEGLVDPVTTVGPSPFYSPSSKVDAAVMLFIKDAGHGVDLVANLPNDTQAIRDARAVEIEWARELLYDLSPS